MPAGASVALFYHLWLPVAVGVERDPHLLVAGEPQPGQGGQGLLAHRPDALHDRPRVAAGVGQRPVQVVHHRQELGGHPGPLGGPASLPLPCVALAEVVEVGHAPSPAVLQAGQRGRGSLVDLSRRLAARLRRWPLPRAHQATT